MLDLGFLEDVERILAAHAQQPPDRAVQRDDAAADPQARRPLPLRPGPHQGQGRDADRRHASSSSSSRSSRPTSPTSSSRCSREERPDQAIVFVRTKIRCDQLYRRLRDKGMNVKALHGDMTQGSRDGVMLGFKGGRVPILVATDVAARGLDISTVTHVVNFDVPVSPDVYVHRIGRTGRVGRCGRAITFVEPKQQRELEAIEQPHRQSRSRRGSPGAHVGAAPVEAKPRAALQAAAQSRNGDETVRAPDRRRRPRRRRRGPRPRRRRDHRRRASTARRSATCKVLERFSLLSVPESEAERVVEAVGGAEVGRTMRSSSPSLPARSLPRERVYATVTVETPETHDRRRSAACSHLLVLRRDGRRPGLVPGVRHRCARPPAARRRAGLPRRRHDRHDRRCCSSAAPWPPATRR